jgi:hypothetical protein
MPQGQPTRNRESWPPTILRLIDDDNDIDILPEDHDIDANPFEYFLTSPEDLNFPDLEDEFFEDLSAGIEGDGTSVTPVREVSPSSLQRISDLDSTDPQDEMEDVEYGFAVPVSLRDFSSAHESKQKAKNKNRADAGSNTTSTLDSAGPSSPVMIPAARGRRTVRLAPNRVSRGRGMARSISHSPKPRSWREPSPDVWSIAEEEEASTPGLSADEAGPEKVEKPIIAGKDQKNPVKKVKRVHWAI